MSKPLNLFAQRDIIMEMVANLVQSMLPEEGLGPTKDTEERMVEIYYALSYALQIPLEDSI